MYKRIMVAIDNDPSFVQVLDEAKRLAASTGSVLAIVHVLGEDAENVKETEQWLEDIRRLINDGLTVETHLLEADPLYGLTGIAETIACSVREWEADLLVVGSANRRGLERFVVGSVAEQVLLNVDASILLVRPHGDGF